MVAIQPIFIEVEREEDGRYLASIPELPGVMGYGMSEAEAKRRVKGIALKVMADLVESCEAVPEQLNALFAG